MRRNILIVGFVLAAAGLAITTELYVSGGASANQCANACYNAHNQCRVATKGSPSCDAQLSRCLAGCGRK